ncbi:DUF1427 family protein [Elioraea rosea]|uniref:DUF1427 family protein n=1 Tax=Elioraea rosea TaxID=2492390 RepID=UPI0011837232
MTIYIASADVGLLVGMVSSVLGVRSPKPAFVKQVGLAFNRLAAVLEAAGCTFDDVVDVLAV